MDFTKNNMIEVKLNKKNKSRTELFLSNAFLLVILVLSIAIAVTIGSVDISISDVYKIILNKLTGLFNDARYTEGVIFDIVWLVRLPRLLMAMLVGFGLSLCGIVMQAIVKNPLADPYILGVSSGASFGATLAIMLGIGASFGGNFVGTSAFLGAFGTSILVIVLANIKSKANSTKLLLSGLAVSALFSAFSSFIVFTSRNREGIRTITYWLMGSVAGVKWNMILSISIIVFLSLIFFMSQYRTLNLMLLGDTAAITLGKNLHYYRLVYIIICSLLIGFLVYSSGMIGFVGLIIPHLARMIFGSDHKNIIFPTCIIGGIFLIWADVLSRVIIKGVELPIGILISLIGAPCFIYLMVSRTYGFGK